MTFFLVGILNQEKIEWVSLINYILCILQVLAKEWKRGTALLYVMPFPFDVVNKSICFDFCVSTTVLKSG